MKRLMVILGILMLIPAFPLWAQTSDKDAALGEKLVREIFENPTSVKLAKAFQTVHQDGPRDRETAIKSLKITNVRNYTLSKFKVTREANILVVTYTFTGHATVEGKVKSKEPSPRLSVFIKKGKEWQWLAHANFIMDKK